MRTVLLTSVAAAALAAASFQVAAQENMPSTGKAPPTAESKRAPATHQMNAAPEQTGRSAATTRDSGAAEKEMTPEKGSAGTEQKARKGSAQKSGIGTESKTTQSPTDEQGTQPATGATTHRKGTAAETKRAPSATTGSATSGSSEQPGKAMERGQSATTPREAPTTRRSSTMGQTPEQASGTSVTLNSSQQTEVRNALANERVQNIDRADFSVTTGTIVPGYVSIQPLPDRIAGIVPEYRGYDYAMVRNDIVIIEPRTRRIVTVMKGQGRIEGRSAVGAPHTRLNLTSRQRQLIRQDLASRGTAIHEQFQLGQSVPEDVSFSTMPGTIVTEIPELRPYSYFATDDGIVLVEPDTREIVEIVR